MGGPFRGRYRGGGCCPNSFPLVLSRILRCPFHGVIVALRGASIVKLVTEYLEHAIRFERMAEESADRAFKRGCQEQAAAYRKLAAQRAKQLNIPLPNPPPALK